MPATISSFDRLFGDPGLIGSVWLDLTAPTLSPKSLHHLVVTSGIIEAAQARTAYGHWRTKTQCKSDPSLRYWKSPTDLQPYLDYKVKSLNPTSLAPAGIHPIRLDSLRTEPIGCVLLVIQDASPNSTPLITLIAAPSMATINTSTPNDEASNEPAGILLSDIWTEPVLHRFLTMLDLDQPHCPVLAASEGFSRATASPTPQLYLEDANPMFLPAGSSCATGWKSRHPYQSTAPSSFPRRALPRLVFAGQRRSLLKISWRASASSAGPTSLSSKLWRQSRKISNNGLTPSTTILQHSPFPHAVIHPYPRLFQPLSTVSIHPPLSITGDFLH